MTVASLSSPQFIYGTAWKEERTAKLAELALRVGFRAIDTANQPKHYAETGVGKGLRLAFAAGVVTREQLFLQTKFTYAAGQDHRMPYDPEAKPGDQVRQSLASSLEHLGTNWVDSFILHGPASEIGWTRVDAEAWEAMREERDAGRARALGVSNISRRHLEQMMEQHRERPAFIQNRCFARQGWDRDVREFCLELGITYQGFSLLTANLQVLRHPLVTSIAAILHAEPAQVVFAFARQIGILPLTGTSNVEHMRQDLEALEIRLPAEAVEQLESMF